MEIQKKKHLRIRNGGAHTQMEFPKYQQHVKTVVVLLEKKHFLEHSSIHDWNDRNSILEVPSKFEFYETGIR